MYGMVDDVKYVSSYTRSGACLPEMKPTWSGCTSSERSVISLLAMTLASNLISVFKKVINRLGSKEIIFEVV